MLERTITNNIIKYLNKLPGCVAEKVSGNSSQQGRPDINGCYKKQSFRIEVKSLDNKNEPTAKQLLNLKLWGLCGSIAIVVYSLEDVEKIFTKEGIKCVNDCYDPQNCPIRYCRVSGIERLRVDKSPVMKRAMKAKFKRGIS